MKMRRLLSVLLAVVMVMSCFSIVAATAAEVDVADEAADVNVAPAAAGSAYLDMQEKITAENHYGLSETVNHGTILQAWNWSFANIEANLEAVAEQGFTTIQVSPPNEIKQATKGVSVTAGDSNGWWMFYQPVGFQLNQSTDNALGTKSEFVSMCTKAHQLGLKVIVDAVINHVGTKDASDSDGNVMNHVNNKVQTYEPEIYNNQLFHSPWKKMQYLESNVSQYDSTYDLTRNCTSGLPDLKTEDSRVQAVIYDYLEELVAAGADGFRFDAAKHIETPDDISSLRSDFWTNTLKKVQNAHSDKEIYAYGEILNTCGVNRPYSMYTKLFDVTDSANYWQIKDAATSGGGNPIPYYPNTNFTKENVMLWDESHDTYMDGATSGLTSIQRGKIWALVAGRAEISSVYLARPDDNGTGSLGGIKLGEARKTSWSNATTKAINQFHNYFIGQNEYCSNSGGTAWIERGTQGAMIVNLGGTTSKTVNLKANKLAEGDYVDAITGNKFTVSGGYIKGQVGNTGVAAIYENNYVAPTDPPETYILGDVDDDGEVDSIDATLIQRYVIGTKDLTAKQLTAADVDGDGVVSVIDATFILRYAAQMTVKYEIGVEKPYNPSVKPTTPVVIPTTTPTPTTTPSPTTAPQPSDEDGFYLVGEMNGWTATTGYLFSENPGNPGEYMLSTTLSAGDKIKVASFANGEATAWYPDGMDNEYTVDAAHAGSVTIYFKPDGNSEWSAFGGYMYIDAGSQPGPDPQPSDGGGYYLVGEMNGWTATTGYQFSENPGNPGEYMLSTTLSAGDKIKVASFANGAATAWYPDGMDNEYTVDAAHAGSVTIYFKPDGNSEWSAFGGYMYIDAGSQPGPDPQPSDGDGYFLVGTMNGWAATSGYQFTENPGNPGEYMLSTTLSAGDGIKVASFAGGAATAWYPDGMDNEYTVDAAHAGSVTIYFNPNGSADWSAFGGYMYIDAGSQPGPDPQPSGDSGYYLVGTMNSWSAASGYQFSENPGNPGEYMLSTTLSAGDGIKVASFANGEATAWYPDGMDNEYTVDAAHAGSVTIYFKPEGNSEWSAFGGYFYIDGGNGGGDDPDPQPSGDSGYYLVGTMNNWAAASGYQFSENPGNPGEYMLSTTLSAGDGIKVANFVNGEAATWYPDGMDNEYTVDAAHAGSVTIYFKPDGNSEWSAFGGYFYIDGGNGGGDDPDPQPSGDSGYYLVGTMNSWQAASGYQFSENPGNPGEYMLSTTLSAGDGIKVANFANGEAATWYPDGMDNEYVVDAAHAGSVTIYFNPNGSADWSAFGGYFYIDGGNGGGDDPDPQPSGDSGYYLVGTMNSWQAASGYQFSENPGNPGEYMLSTTLSAGDGIKVANFVNGEAATWYPDGMDNEYVVDAAHAGSVTIYFNPNGSADWSAFGGYMYIDGGNGGGGDTPIDPQPSGSDITFIPGDAAQANPAWFAWVWGNGESGKWINGTTSGSNVVFPGAGNYTNMVIVRMPTGSSSADWNTKWNQSDDLTISGSTCSFAGWNNDKFYVSWS